MLRRRWRERGGANPTYELPPLFADLRATRSCFFSPQAGAMMAAPAAATRRCRNHYLCNRPGLRCCAEWMKIRVTTRTGSVATDGQLFTALRRYPWRLTQEAKGSPRRFASLEPTPRNVEPRLSGQLDCGNSIGVCRPTAGPGLARQRGLARGEGAQTLS